MKPRSRSPWLCWLVLVALGLFLVGEAWGESGCHGAKGAKGGNNGDKKVAVDR